jgi:hypothetical protein
MRELKTYICGCVRNCETHLNSVFQNIRNISQLFSDYQIIIAYDESSDYSFNQLHKIRKTFPDGKMTVLMSDTISLTSIRTQNISNARNRILDEIRQNQKPNFDYFIMMDMDDICAGKMNISALDKYLHHERDGNPIKWDALTFNRPNYYDVWALSIKPYTFSCWHYSKGRTIATEMKKFIQNKLAETGDNELIPCISAFNGFGIYRIEKYINIDYEWDVRRTLEIYPKNMIDIMSRHVGLEPIARFDDCEHRYYHICAAKTNGAQIFISPDCLFKGNH